MKASHDDDSKDGEAFIHSKMLIAAFMFSVFLWCQEVMKEITQQSACQHINFCRFLSSEREKEILNEFKDTLDWWRKPPHIRMNMRLVTHCDRPATAGMSFLFANSHDLQKWKKICLRTNHQFHGNKNVVKVKSIELPFLSKCILMTFTNMFIIRFAKKCTRHTQQTTQIKKKEKIHLNYSQPHSQLQRR